jgi:endonuclease/exonuclease/phosphatase family metal-dependent hydrolase
VLTKILFIFAAALFGTHVYGQSMGGWNCFEIHFFTDLVHPADMDCPGGWTPGGGGPGGPGNPPPKPPSRDVTIMTYNIYKQKYTQNGDLIKNSGADVVAVQEISFWTSVYLHNAFIVLQVAANMKGELFFTRPWIQYGIALMWKPSLGDPIRTVTKRVKTNDSDGKRGFIIAEWSDFIVLSTHFPTHAGGGDADKEKMIRHIFRESVMYSAKPVFLAGDFNFQPNYGHLMGKFTEQGYKVLNNITDTRTCEHCNKTEYVGATSNINLDKNPCRRMVDLILGKTNTQRYQVLDQGIPFNLKFPDHKLSDHLPYFVKVKLNP